VQSDAEVPAGVDGEAVTLTAPLEFSILPAALRVRIAPQHPGASPSAALPQRPWQSVPTLVAIAAGRR